MRIPSEGAQRWAWEEFGEARLGNTRRTQRLVRIAAFLGDAPEGKVTQVFHQSADLEGTYRFLGNDRFGTDDVAAATFAATAQRAAKHDFAFVPVDGSSLKVTDTGGTKGLGIVGTRQKGARGLKVMTAIALSPSGTPLGLCGQHYWVRNKKRGAERKDRKLRSIKNKETRHWITVVDQAKCTLAATGVRAWFQFDREADFRELLLKATSDDSYDTTVRSSSDRCLVDGGCLSEALERAPIAGCFVLHVAGGNGRQKREAWCELRFCTVTLLLTGRKAPRRAVTLQAVLVREMGTCPAGERPLEWRLLTTRVLRTAQDAWSVAEGYALRWRVEDFHKTWKSVCGAEDTQLGTPDAIKRWCTILAAVAMRIERLKHLSRNTPEEPATVEFTRTEIDAIILIRDPKGFELGDTPTIGEVVRWIADEGGYTGKSSGGPPGAIVLGRGLQRLDMAVATLKAVKKRRRRKK